MIALVAFRAVLSRHSLRGHFVAEAWVTPVAVVANLVAVALSFGGVDLALRRARGPLPDACPRCGGALCLRVLRA